MNDKELDKQQLEKENAELKAQVKALSTLNPALYTGISYDSDEIDLKELWSAIWKGKWLIIAITSVFALASVLYALNLPNEYKSTAILAPASQSGAGGLSKLAGQFGGLASLAGINIGGGGAEDKSVIAMEIIKTWGFLEKFIEDNNIEVEVFAAKGWNRSSNQLTIDSDLYDVINKKWIRDFDPNKGQKSKPSSWELYKEIKNRINVSQDKTSGLITLSVEYYSPNLAKEWTDKLIVAINNYIQKKDRDEAEKNIEYLNKEINETNIADMQSILYKLIEEQKKTLMLAEVSSEYVFKTMSGAKVAEENFKPKRVLICVLGIILGGIFSMVIVLVRYFSSNKN